MTATGPNDPTTETPGPPAAPFEAPPVDAPAAPVDLDDVAEDSRTFTLTEDELLGLLKRAQAEAAPVPGAVVGGPAAANVAPAPEKEWPDDTTVADQNPVYSRPDGSLYMTPWYGDPEHPAHRQILGRVLP